MSTQIAIQDVVRFWKEAGAAKWYAKDDAFDADFRHRFHDAHVAAARGELNDWMETPEGALALMILLDQYPRNSYRGTGHQFATDGLALSLAKQAIAKGYPQTFEPELRQFLLMPLMHSEVLADQDALLPLCDDMPETLKFAHIHRDIIVRFGRFPHRNACLGRVTTPEEQVFLAGDGFKG
jgi:uncharacterized protein (DUF924 family)